MQEAGLGMDFYHCDAAAVITNSTCSALMLLFKHLRLFGVLGIIGGICFLQFCSKLKRALDNYLRWRIKNKKS